MDKHKSAETLSGIVTEYNAGKMTFGEMVRRVYLTGAIDGNTAMLAAFDKLGDAGMSFTDARMTCTLRLMQEMMAVIDTLVPDDVECDA